MKKIVMTGVIATFFMGAGFAQEMNELPRNASDFIKQHFSTAQVEEVESNDKWYNINKKEMYEVELSDGTEIDFDRDGNVTEIESETMIPEAALPQSIVSYVKANYSNANITEWEVSDNEHEIMLSDGTELEFDGNGEFMKED